MPNKDHINRIYSEAYHVHGNSHKSVLWPKGRQELRFDNLLAPIFNSNKINSLLDFGCGLGHMAEFLERNSSRKIEYNGVDINSDFITDCQNRGINAQLINSVTDIEDNFDAIVCSGVFNIKYVHGKAENQNIIFAELDVLIKNATKYFSCDFMRSQVDYQQPNAWHQELEPLVNFATKYSRSMEVVMTTLPYEFTLRLYK